MLPPDWDELAPLLDAVLNAPPEQRAAVLLELSGGDQRRHAQLEALVAECALDAPLLARPAGERFPALLDEEVDLPLPEMLGGRYRINAEIGRGGMARVYLAHDEKHARRVAVKVIRPDLAASLGRDRFLREIRIAARLRHPNIVPLYDSGDADGVLYFVMPYEEGPSLQARARTGSPLTTAERISILRDVARALAYAHDQGVVHRDVKPDNVMLSGGAAVVTDFGISKAVSVAQDVTAAGNLTQSGAGIGTPAYMAPEQAVGDPSTDHRADIYSFGCLAYELFAGNPPFHDMPLHKIIAAHVGTTPVPVGEAGRDVPGNVASLIAQCLEKSPDARPQSARELLARLEGGATEPVMRARRRLSRSATAALIAGAVIIVAGAAYIVSRSQTSSVARARGERTVAVLPLLSVGGDSLQQELADGLSDEVATALFRVAGIRVVSRRGVGNYRGQRDVDPEKIGRELGARFLVMGSLRDVNGRLVVLTQLLDASDGAILWSDRFDRVQGDLGKVRDEIAAAVGDTLRRTLGATERAPAGPEKVGHVPISDAYVLYVIAQRALDRRGQSIQASADLFRRATLIDTLYAKAYSGLSLALALTPYFSATSTTAVAAEVTSSAERALRLDPTLAQPHIALGLVHQHAYEWERAAREFRTAVALDSRDVEARVQYGRHLLFRNRVSEGLEQFTAARHEDPASALVLSWISYGNYLQGQLDSAVAMSALAFQSDSTNLTTLVLGALVRFRANRIREALAFAERLRPADQITLYVLAASGDTATAMERLRKLENTRPRPWMVETTRAYAMLGAGDTAKALTALERATDANETWPMSESTRDPIFDPVRGSPRFQRLLVRVGLR